MSAPTTIWAADVKAGKLVLDRTAEFRAHVASLRDGRYELTLRKAVNRRGSAQNRYYRGCVLPIFADSLGWQREDLHYELRKKFLGDPDPMRPPRSTADLDTVEFTRFVEDVRRLAAEYSVAIPGPNEVE